ncbi:MAG: aminodeoxychorismate/anthranilate synthase component II [Chitinophagaceae bacterium]
MNILLIDNYDSYTYNIVHMLHRHTSIRVHIYKNDQIPFANLNQFQKIIISPGPALPKDSGELLRLIATTHKTHSMLGICLGHQAIAEVFGSQLFRLASPYHGFQTHIRSTQSHSLFNNIAMPMQVGLYHSWAVEKESLTQDLIATSFSDEGLLMSFKHQHLDIHGVQFHPESYMTPQGHELINQFLFPNN